MAITGIRQSVTRAILASCCLCTIASAEVDFARDIAPILESRCVECHQPNIMKGDLSVATRADILDSGAIQPEQPDKSRLLSMVTGAKPEMPKDGPPLSKDDVAKLRAWIAAGAPWPDSIVIKEKSKADSSWWSLQPLQNDDPPEGGQRNPIDRFIAAKLSSKNIAPSPEADRRTLIRRLYFDLIGLPPTFEAVRAFEADTRPDAYERLVDELLASRHYGERWARHWLDIAHYADTHGFERDMRRDNAFRYRDYVIRAFNEDKPYDQFLREQIAGDILNPESRDAVIATGFLAAGPWDFVGQVETKSPALRRAARMDDLDDMVTTVVTATMGLTVNCARCHDHKLDPISQKDYYRLTSVFAGTTRGPRTVSPAYDEAQDRIAAIQDELRALKRQPIDLANIVAGGDGFGSDEYPRGIDVRTGKVVAESTAALNEIKLNEYVLADDVPFIDGVFVPGKGEIVITSTGITIDDLPPTSGASWDHILNGKVTSQDSTTIDGVDYAKASHRLIGIHANKGITFDIAAVREAHNCGPLRFTAVVGYGGDAEKTKADYHIYVDGQLRSSRRNFGYTDGGNTVAFDIAGDERFLTIITTDGRDGIGYDQVFLGDPQLTMLDQDQFQTDAQQATVEKLIDELTQLTDQFPPDNPPDSVYATIPIAPPTTHVLMRGNPEMPADIVTPGAISSLSHRSPDLAKDDSDEGDRRVALANWITDPANPLTARVWVNRLWHYHFGAGIVDTPSDFGYGGGRPTHPELLDWLATELIRQEWSTKAMHRLIVTSQAYRQISVLDANYDFDRYIDPRTTDADNRLLWRMNPSRLEAEIVRDSVLFTAGTLNTEPFGPGFQDFDYEQEYAPKYFYYTQDKPEHWRRSIYRFVVRTSPQPFMTTLDCPNPAVLTPVRLKTTTAIQSLALLNNEFMLKQSEYFANRIRENVGGDIDAQIGEAFRIALGRDPDSYERVRAMPLVKSQGLPALCRVIFNMNEFVHID